MKQTLMTILRDRTTDMATFRHASNKLALILAGQTSQYLARESFEVLTSFGKAKGVRFKGGIVLVPILRSGLALLPAFAKFYEDATVGFVGLARDEETAKAHLYYKKLPMIGSGDKVLVLDPMIATGGSGIEALKILTEAGVKQEQIVFVALIASQDGINNLAEAFPKITLTVAQVDPELNDEKCIVPGLGDFGDRYFGTEESK